MRRTAAVVLTMFCLTGASAQRRGPGRSFGPRASYEAPPLAKTDREKQILAVLDEIQAAGRTYASVPVSDGRLLRLLTEAVNAKTVVEIGTSTGYSGLWFCLALEKTGGKLTTFEYDRGRAATARRHFEQAGVASIATVIEGDAHEKIKALRGPIDVVFIDADKDGYGDYLNTLLPLVRPGGLIFAHNIDMLDVLETYIKRVTANPDLETMFYRDGGGLSVTLKKR